MEMNRIAAENRHRFSCATGTKSVRLGLDQPHGTADQAAHGGTGEGRTEMREAEIKLRRPDQPHTSQHPELHQMDGCLQGADGMKW